MLRKLLMGMCVFGVCAFLIPHAVASDCSCKAIAKAKQGFCDACNKGQIFGEKLTSHKLYEALHGLNVETAKMKCSSCKRMAKKNGECVSCKVGFAHGRMYLSPVAHSIALGKPYSAEKASKCSTCKKAHTKHSFCSTCDVGFVNGRLYRSINNHVHALQSRDVVRSAIRMSKNCEDCAVAMVTHAKCEKCDVSFDKSGRAIKKPKDRE